MPTLQALLLNLDNGAAILKNGTEQERGMEPVLF